MILALLVIGLSRGLVEYSKPSTKEFRENLAYQYLDAQGRYLLSVGGLRKRIVSPEGGFYDVSYSAATNVVFAHHEIEQLLRVNRSNGQTVRETLQSIAGRSLPILQRARAFQPQDVSTVIDPTGKFLYIQLSTPIQLWRLNLASRAVELVADQAKLEKLAGKKLEWDHSDEPGPHGWTIRISPSGSIAISLPGRLVGNIGQRYADTYVLPFAGDALRNCGQGSPLLWLSQTKLLVSDQLEMPFVKGQNSSIAEDVVRLIDFEHGRRVSVRGYATAVFDGKLIWLLRNEVNRTRTRSKLTYFQAFTQDLKPVKALKLFVSPVPSISYDSGGNICAVWIGPLRK